MICKALLSTYDTDYRYIEGQKVEKRWAVTDGRISRDNTSLLYKQYVDANGAAQPMLGNQ